MKLTKGKLLRLVKEEVKQYISDSESDIEAIYHFDEENINESDRVDGKYFVRQMQYYVEEAEDRNERKFLQYLKDRVEQHFPSGDLTKKDLEDFADESAIKSIARKIDADMLIDYVWEQIALY